MSDVVPVSKILEYYSYSAKDVNRLPLVTILTLIKLYYNR